MLEMFCTLYKMVKIAISTKWILCKIVKYVYYRSFVSENFPKELKDIREDISRAEIK